MTKTQFGSRRPCEHHRGSDRGARRTGPACAAAVRGSARARTAGAPRLSRLAL